MRVAELRTMLERVRDAQGGAKAVVITKAGLFIRVRGRQAGRISEGSFFAVSMPGFAS